MNSYLTIAQEVLRLIRRPLTSREIVEIAYRRDLVPSHLFGKTQHKTFGARLSEDILARREQSLFFRSEPGKFFLREFLADPSIPDAYKSPITARRRERDLKRGANLGWDVRTARAASSGAVEPHQALKKALEQSAFCYFTDKEVTLTTIQVWCYVVFKRNNEVLTFRHGRYREGRDAFLKKRSIGFYTPVSDRDVDLFNDDDLGISSSGLRAIAFDLDLPHFVFNEKYRPKMELSDFVLASDEAGKEDLLAIIDMECPPRFEPLTRRLAINDLAWMRLDQPVNHLEDFDPWSRTVMARRFSSPVEWASRT